MLVKSLTSSFLSTLSNIYNINFPTFSIRINSKRNFDEIGHGNDWGRFVRKRNFDEIDGGRFDSRFVKKVNISIVVPYIFLP